MYTIYLIFLLCCAVPFLFVMLRDPRTLWSGVWFVFLLGGLAGGLLLVSYQFLDWLSAYPALRSVLVFLAIAAILGILAFPAALILTFFVEGVKVLKHEGLRPANLLSLLFAICLCVYLIVWPMMAKFALGSISTLLYLFIGFTVSYLLFLMAMYALSALLNLVHLRKRRKLDYIVVLGCGLNGSQVTPLLASRIDRGIQLLRCNPNAKLILSGGQGPGEDVPEGVAMAAYAKEHGVEPERIITEENSTDTRENLLCSRSLMTVERPKIAIVTTSYHVFRSLLLARQCHIRCVGFGAKTKWYFTLNALIREFVGYLSLSWKRHAWVVGGVAGLLVLTEVLFLAFR